MSEPRKMDSRFRGNDEQDVEAPSWVTSELPSGRVRPAWVTHFLAGLIVTGSLRQALAGIDFETAWELGKAEPEFAMYWDRAVRVHRRVMGGEDFLDAVAAEEEMFQ